MLIVHLPGLFSLGQIFVTPGAEKALKDARQSPLEFLARHASGDWGDLSEDDKKENEFSIRQNFRIVSSYKTALGEEAWVITEADRSATTILLPEEY